MAKGRSTVKHSIANASVRSHREQVVNDIAFEAGAGLEVEELSVYVVSGGMRELLCVAADSKSLWSSALSAICARYPHLARQS
jgi:hypothetical protein